MRKSRLGVNRGIIVRIGRGVRLGTLSRMLPRDAVLVDVRSECGVIELKLHHADYPTLAEGDQYPVHDYTKLAK